MRYDDWNTAFMLNNQASQYLVNRINHKISTQKRKKIARVSKKTRYLHLQNPKSGLAALRTCFSMIFI